MYPIRDDIQDLAYHDAGRFQAGLGSIQVSPVGSLVLLEVYLIPVNIHRNIKLRDIGVVETVTADPFLLGPFPQSPEVFPESVCEHLCFLANLLFGTMEIVGPTARLHELVGLQIEVQQTAFQVAIIQVVGFHRPDTHLLAQLRVTGEYHRSPSGELVPELVSQGPVNAPEFLYLPQALAVRGVHCNQAHTAPCGRRGHQRVDIPALHVNLSGEPCPVQVGNRFPDSAALGVVPYHDRKAAMGLFLTVAGLNLEAGPDAAFMLLPTCESPGLAEQPRSNIAGDEGRFNEESPGTAHGINKGSALGGDGWPPGTQEDSASQVLFEGGVSHIKPVASFVKRFARKVQAHRALVFRQVHVDPGVGLAHLHRGTVPGKFPEAVHHGVFGL